MYSLLSSESVKQLAIETTFEVLGGVSKSKSVYSL